MIGHQAGFTALHVTDHVPFYPTLYGEGLDFRDTLFRVILTKDANTRFNRCLNDLQGLGLGYDNEMDFARITAGPPCCLCDLIEDTLIILPDDNDDVIHGMIIISPFIHIICLLYSRQMSAPN